MTADIKVLKETHSELADTYRQVVRVRQEPVLNRDNEPVIVNGEVLMRTVYPTAAELSAANAFLKQNNITAEPEKGDDLDELRKQVARSRRRRPVMDDFDSLDGVPGLQ